jgi:hypothetical protein
MGETGESDPNYVPGPRAKRESPPLPTPLTPEEVWKTAKLLMDRDPNDAVVGTIHRAKELADDDDQEGAQAWVRVADPIERMKSMTRA